MFSAISDTYAYQRADAATKVEPYKSIKLEAVVDQIGEALKLVHSTGFFETYTRHGPEHSAALVLSLDWIIEEEQRSHLTDADYLMIVLSCLVHDLGMLANRETFEKRIISIMTRFEENLNTDKAGREFLASIPNAYRDRDELLFEEFIRRKHPRRVALALTGESDPDVGDVAAISKVFGECFHGLNAKVRADLALICESHHKSDLYDLDIYKRKSVHGQFADAQVNVQACCVILRAADILQIGTGRTPSIAFDLISPSNPISYLEWAKEMGVTRVAGQRVSVPDSTPQSVVNIYGFFEDADPFFALMNHVRYATAELQRCVEWTSASSSADKDYRFRWSAIDTSEVEAHGFEREKFSFQIDREKILQLLIGHTLYNDTRVVVRELVQNAIDAVRLRALDGKQPPAEVNASLDAKERRLIITDNGTGMTANTIIKHLLTVGSSYYNTEDFARQHPSFAPISRFGIGILTSFMVADEIEILTSHETEPQARRISINGPSGTYLIKLVDKQTLEGQFCGRNIGTRIALTLRAQSSPIRLIQELRLWFGFPQCRLTGTNDDGTVCEIGYDHPADLLNEALELWRQREKGLERWSKYAVVRHDEPGRFDAAYLTRTSIYSGLPSLAFASEYAGRRPEEGDLPRSIGIFLQGVRVEAGSPGFRGEGPLAVVNGLGKSVPRTNVARSGIEQGDESRQFLSAIYRMYIKALRGSVQSGGSITKVGRMANFALGQLSVSSASDQEVLQQELDNEATIVVETDAGRQVVSRTTFASYPAFETISSTVARTVDDLLSTLPVNRSLNEVLTALGVSNGVPVQTGVLLTAPDLHLDRRELETLSVVKIAFVGEPRQALIEWKRVTEADPAEAVVLDILKRLSVREARPVFIVRKDAVEDEMRWRPQTILRTGYCVFMHPDNTEAERLRALAGRADDRAENIQTRQAALAIILSRWHNDVNNQRPIEEFAREYARGADLDVEALKGIIAPFSSMQVVDLERYSEYEPAIA